VQGSDSGLCLELAESVATQRCLQDGDALSDERAVPAGAILLGQGTRLPSRRVRVGRRAWCSSIKASSPAVSSSSIIDANCRVSRIASAARSTSPV
jgi:hypothetical protein